MINSSRRAIWLAIVLIIVAVLLGFGRRWWLRAEYEFLTRILDRDGVTLEIAGVSELRMFLNPADQMITPRIQKHRSWEGKETLWFTRIVKPGDTVVDIGANVGYYTLIASRLVGKSGRVFAFEPDPVSFALLERNVALNDLTNVVAEQKAVSNQAGTLRLFIAERNKGDHRIYQPKGEERPYVEVESVVLDDYFAGDQRGVDFVKIDTQGAEVVILEGMSRLLRDTDDLSLAVEYWPSGLADFGSSVDRLLEILSEARLRTFEVKGGARGPLREVTADQLRARFAPGQAGFTNLLAVKDGVHTQNLRAQGALLHAPAR